MIRKLMLEDENGVVVAYERDERDYNRWHLRVPGTAGASDNTFEDATVLWSFVRALVEHGDAP